MPIPADVLTRTQTHEAVVLWPYLDSAKEPHVTIGYGHMVPDLAAFDALPLVGPDSSTVADFAAKKAAWDAIQAMVKEQRDRTKPENKFAAKHYETATSVRLPIAEATKLLSTDLEIAIAEVEKTFPNHSDYPASGKAGLIDMMFNMGPSRFTATLWPKFFAAMNISSPPPDRKAAAGHSRRPQLSDDRNKEIKELFEEAGTIQGVP